LRVQPVSFDKVAVRDNRELLIGLTFVVYLLVMLIIGVIAWRRTRDLAQRVVMAMDPDSRVLDLVSYAWAGSGAAFGPAVLLSLYWSGMNRWGALAGILAGGLTVVVWKPLEGGLFDLYEIVPGFLVTALAIWFVSRLTCDSQARV
jgi:Na+/proline symporter